MRWIEITSNLVIHGNGLAVMGPWKTHIGNFSARIFGLGKG